MRCAALRQIKFEDVTFAANASKTPVDTWKHIAYKLGHVLALQEWQRECCSKEDVADALPELAIFLSRQPCTREQLVQLTHILARFLNHVDRMIQQDPTLADSREVLQWF
jgi:hypothetical protein